MLVQIKIIIVFIDLILVAEIPKFGFPKSWFRSFTSYDSNSSAVFD